jgi:hypothetical protein
MIKTDTDYQRLVRIETKLSALIETLTTRLGLIESKLDECIWADEQEEADDPQQKLFP